MIHLAHPRIEARNDPRRAGALSDRRERADAEHRQAARSSDALRDTARDAQPGERSRPGAERDAVQIPETDSRATEKRVDLAHDELRVPLPCRDRSFVDDATRAHRKRQDLGRGLDRENVHVAAILAAANALHFPPVPRAAASTTAG